MATMPNIYASNIIIRLGTLVRKSLYVVLQCPQSLPEYLEPVIVIELKWEIISY